MFELTEQVGDLFQDSPVNASLVHCVGRDFIMGRGIAVEFKKRFGRVNELLQQNKQVGQCAFLEDNESLLESTKEKGRYIFYLVTKESSTKSKPTLASLKSSLLDLKVAISKLGITVLCMPKIGCGLDRLDWSQVKTLLIAIFQDMNITLKIINK